MRSILQSYFFTVLLLAASNSLAQEAPLKLVQTIPMPDVSGRLDHLYVDAPSQRLFVAGLEKGSVEVVDLKNGKWLSSIPGFKKPQGILLLPAKNKLFVTSGDDGKLRIFSSDSLQLFHTIDLELGANRLIYDGRKNLLYLGYGGKDAGEDHGVVGIFDIASDRVIATVRVDAHPAELLLDRTGKKLFVLVPAKNEVQVIDTKSRKIIGTWPVSSKGPGDADLDESRHRLMIGTHVPPSMVVMDTKSGKEAASLPTVDGMDGVYFDPTLQRIYVSGGRGFDIGSVFVYQRTSKDQYEILGKVPTRAGAGTSFWSPELKRYYVAAPAHGNDQASILVFEAVKK